MTIGRARYATAAHGGVAALTGLALVLLLAAPDAAGVAGAEPANGRPRILRLDPAASRISFSVGATFHTVEGEARLTKGEIRFDTSSGRASGRIVIDATSLMTHDEKRDRTMHADVLESATYPEIVFEPERIEGAFVENAESVLRLPGILSIHGAKHDVVLNARVIAAGERITGTCGFSVPYVEWGMKNPSLLVLRVRKEVAVEVRIVGSLLDEHPKTER